MAALVFAGAVCTVGVVVPGRGSSVQLFIVLVAFRQFFLCQSFAAGHQVILTGFTFIFYTLSNLDDEMMEAFCPGKPWKLNEEFDLLFTIEDAVYELDYYSDLASNFMCSTTCPCLVNDA